MTISHFFGLYESFRKSPAESAFVYINERSYLIFPNFSSSKSTPLHRSSDEFWGFRKQLRVNKPTMSIYALLECYAAYSSSLSQTFRDILAVPTSNVKQFKNNVNCYYITTAYKIISSVMHIIPEF